MKPLLLVLLSLVTYSLFSQNSLENTDYQIEIKKAIGKIELDGQLLEESWQKASVAQDFFQSKPNDKEIAQTRTVVSLTYDDRFLYVGAICYDELGNDYVIQSLKRDFSFPITDAFGVFIDPFGNKNAGVSFAVSPLGVQREGLVLSGGEFGVTTSWDNKWFSKVTREEGKWTVEMAIPFKTLRYSENVTEWGINFARNDLKRVETSTWVPVPTQFNVANLAFSGVLKWDAPPKKAGSNISLIPYVKTGVSKDVALGEKTEFDRPEGGFDAKVAITSSLNLDVTVNSDFSQIEVDRQVTNLDRFSIFFPERRGFFIENSDLFNFGISPIRPFFSRRIGLTDGDPIPILLGARLTGNLNQKWRMGLLSIQTEGKSGGVQSQNYSVANIERRLWKQSSVNAFLINRQSFTNFSIDKDDYNRILGTEFNFRSTGNKWTGKVLYHQSFTARDSEVFEPLSFEKRMSIVGHAQYNTRNFYVFNSLEYVGEQYLADVGFIQELTHRNDELGITETVPYLSSLHFIGVRKFAKKASSRTRFYGAEIKGKVFANPRNLNITDTKYSLSLVNVFKDNSEINLIGNTYNTRLYYPTNITGLLDSLLPPDNYRYNDLEVKMIRNKRSKLNGEVRAIYGGFYNGTKFTFSSDITYRVQPWGNFSLNFVYNNIDFPTGFNDAELFLIGPRLELTFSKSVFFTTFLQYNTQSENFNINNRFQWRFAPMSDLFIVFTDNMTTTNFEQKNWGLVMKLNYWLTL